jgi:hypothetical protein
VHELAFGSAQLEPSAAIANLDETFAHI